MDPNEQIRKHETCEHRSVEKVTKEVKICCGRTTSITEYWCDIKQTLLTQPICHDCQLYKAKI